MQGWVPFCGFMIAAADQVAVSAIRLREKPLPGLTPGHGLNGPCVQLLHAPLDLGTPGPVGTGLGVSLQALDQACGQLCTLMFVEGHGGPIKIVFCHSHVQIPPLTRLSKSAVFFARKGAKGYPSKCPGTRSVVPIFRADLQAWLEKGTAPLSSGAKSVLAGPALGE
jgi:hypothetical protein